MSKFRFITIILIITFFGLIINSSLAEQNNPDTLFSLLSSSGAKVDSIELTYGGKIGKYNKDDLTAFKKRIEKTFSIDMVAPEKPCCVQVAYQYIGMKKVPTNTLEIKLESLKNHNSEKKLETFLILKLVLRKPSVDNLNETYAFLTRKLSELGLEPEINTTIQGKLNAKLTHDQQTQLLRKMFNQANGKIIEGLNEKDVVSYTGFSDLFTRSTKSNNQSINLEIASRYDSHSKRTVITIGNPIISTNY